MGAQVQVIPFPLDNLAQLQKQYKVIQAYLGNITGVIHAAGIIDTENPAFIRKTPTTIAKVLSPKVEGLQNLMQVLDHEQLQFVLLFSSLSSQIPRLGAGHSDYVMGNSFMDYYALAHQHLPIVSVQWPSWKQTGMGEIKSATYLGAGFLSITDEEGLGLFDRIVANLDNSVVMPLVVNPTKFNPDTLLQIPKVDPPPETKLVEKPAPAADGTLNWLQSLFAQELKMSPQQLDPEASFADYGIDSILLAQILRRINDELDLELDLSVLLEYSTLETLAAWLQQSHASTVSQQLPSEAETHHFQEQLDSHYYEVEKEKQVVTSHNRKEEAIAVVGMACRFPGAPNIEEYWNLLQQGKSAIAPYS